MKTRAGWPCHGERRGWWDGAFPGPSAVSHCRANEIAGLEGGLGINPRGNSLLPSILGILPAFQSCLAVLRRFSDG